MKTNDINVTQKQTSKVVATYMAVLQNHIESEQAFGISCTDDIYRAIHIREAKEGNISYETVPEDLKNLTLDDIHILNVDDSYKPFWLELKSSICIWDTPLMHFILTKGISIDKLMVAELENRGALKRVKKD